MFLIQSGSFDSSANEFGTAIQINNKIKKLTMALFFLTFTFGTSFFFWITNFTV
jgi:hypothetical protein